MKIGILFLDAAITPAGIDGSNYCITSRIDSGNERFYRLRLGD